MPAAPPEMDLDMRCGAAEHIDLIVDREWERAAKQLLGEDAARNVAIGPFVEPAPVGSALPAAGCSAQLLPSRAVGHGRDDPILIAAVRDLMIAGAGNGISQGRSVPCQSVGTIHSSPSRVPAKRFAAILSIIWVWSGDRSVSFLSCTSSVKRVGWFQSMRRPWRQP